MLHFIDLYITLLTKIRTVFKNIIKKQRKTGNRSKETCGCLINHDHTFGRGQPVQDRKVFNKTGPDLAFLILADSDTRPTCPTEK